MSVRVVHIHICDRCGDEFVYESGEETIGDLSFMVKTNGSGSKNSHMSWDFCPPCTSQFLRFVKGE